MAKTTWGRKETIIWPRHMPIYTYGLAFAIAASTFVAVCLRIHLAAPLQRYYLPVYERASVFGAFTVTHRSMARTLFVSGRHVASRARARVFRAAPVSVKCRPRRRKRTCQARSD